MKSLFSYTINKGLSFRYASFLFQAKHPLQVQDKIFRDLIHKAEKTVYGKEYGYSSIKDPETFRQRTPLNDYNSLKKYIDLILAGEKDVLYPGRVKWFAKSSGTTNDKSKYIPVTNDALNKCHYKAGRELIALVFNLIPETEVYYGSGLVLGGSQQINKHSHHSRIGDLSSILLHNLPLWTKFWQEPSYKSIFYEDWEQKIEIIARKVLNKRITHITGVPTWTVVLFNKLLEISGKNNIYELWPSLELYVHGGVNFAPYEALFKKYIPNEKMIYLETYNASEGFFGLQDQLDTKDMLLLCDHGVYYEFIPADEMHKENPKVIGLEDVVPDKNYIIVITTNGGLWRYMIGDTLRFTSVNPYRFRLTGRTKHFINAFGEELIVENAETAIAAASKMTNAIIKDFTAAPLYFEEKGKASHEWVIEFEQAPDNITTFTEILDQKLKEVNSDYEAKRHKDLALGAPLIHNVNKGTFYNWMKTKNKLGGQNKVPRLANDRDYIDDLLKFINK